MECNNHKDCHRRLRKIIKKVEKEIIKADSFLQECDDNEICYDPDKDEKKKIINAIKAKSPNNCRLIEELKTHRREIKYLFDTYIKVTQKNERLKNLRKKQLEQIENIQCYLKNELLPMAKLQQRKPNTKIFKISNQPENEELEKIYKGITSQYTVLSKEYDEYIKTFNKRLNHMTEENNRDRMLFCLATKYIQKAFEIRTKIECKPTNFMDYCCFESQSDLDEEKHPSRKCPSPKEPRKQKKC